jgi:hypothetical protein
MAAGARQDGERLVPPGALEHEVVRRLVNQDPERVGDDGPDGDRQDEENPERSPPDPDAEP